MEVKKEIYAKEYIKRRIFVEWVNVYTGLNGKAIEI